MRSGFVRASELYDVDSRTPIAHPIHQATDADVRRALEDREICTDGGQPSSGTDHSSGRNLLLPQEHWSRPIGRTRPDESTFAAYTDPQHSQIPTTRLFCVILFTQFVNAISNTGNTIIGFCLRKSGLGYLYQSLHTGTDRSPSDSENSTRNGGADQ